MDQSTKKEVTRFAKAWGWTEARTVEYLIHVGIGRCTALETYASKGAKKPKAKAKAKTKTRAPKAKTKTRAPKAKSKKTSAPKKAKPEVTRPESSNGASAVN